MNGHLSPRQRGEGVKTMLKRLWQRSAREEGQTMAEYAVVLAVITVATVAVFTALSGGIQGALGNVTGIL
jgi:Flp pilus assembly pilin Flp